VKKIAKVGKKKPSPT